MHIIRQIQALVRTLPLNAVLKIIYLIHELPSTKHLVSMDAYTILLLQPLLKHFQNFIKFEYFPVSHINIYQNSFTSCNHHHTNIARYSHSIHAIKWSGQILLTSQVYHPYHLALQQSISGSQLIMTILHSQQPSKQFQNYH